MPRRPKAEETGAPVRAAPAGVPVGSLTPGDTFTYRGEDFSLSGVDGDVAKVVLLEEIDIQVSPGRFKKGQQGIARLEMPVETIVQPK